MSQIFHLVREPSTEAKKEALPFQKVAVDKVKDLEYGAIFHEQGLGKTKIAIDIMLYWLENKIVDTIMIVTKKSLIDNWNNELSFHSHLKPKILTNDKNSNYYIFNNVSRIVLTNYETIITENKRIKLFLKTRDVGIIADESAKLKNPESKLTKAFFDISKDFKRRIIMTGTPVANRPFDIWAQIFFLDQGNSLGTDFDSFKNNTDLKNTLNTNINEKNTFEKSISNIFNKISDFSIRETKNNGVVTLPPKKYIDVYANFENNQEKTYNEIKKQECTIVMKNEEYTIDDSEAIIKRLTRLLQVTSNPKLINESYCGTPGKYTALLDLLDKIDFSKDKCIIWTNYVENVNWLYSKLEKYNPVKVHGSMDMDARNASIHHFVNDPEYKIFIATPASSKEGLTLTVANHSIFYDRNLSLDDYLQAQDRIHRISQTKTCYIYNIKIANSIDEWVDKLLQCKNLAAKLTQGDISLKEYQAEVDYSFADIIKEILVGSNEY